MKRIYFLIIMFSIVLFTGCNEKKYYSKKPFFDSRKKQIGDSIFIDNIIDKIVFTDSSYVIDSVVFRRYNSTNNVKSTETFNDGKNIFENVYYYENGNIKNYSFINGYNKNYFYERVYDNKGIIMKVNGYLFFQGYIVDTISKNLDIKIGSTINYRIYYPNPPDCRVKLYIKYDDSTLYDVFKKSEFLNFLQTVYQDNDELGVFKTDILLELKENSIDTTIRYNHELIYKVIP